MTAILQAAEEVFADLGYAKATTNKIAARAGVSVGSLYQYFPNKDSLLLALRHQHHRAVHEVVDAAQVRLKDPSVPLSEGLGPLLQGLVDLHAENPALNRVLGENVRTLHTPTDAHANDAQADGDHAREVEHHVVEVEEMLRRRPDVTVPDTTLAAHLLVRTIESLTRWLVHEAPTTLDKGAFVQEVLAMLVRYLQNDRAAGKNDTAAGSMPTGRGDST